MQTMKNRLTAKDFDQRILELYDHYAHGKITKREFLKNIGKYTAAGVTALSIFNSLAPNYALAEQVNFNDPDIKANYITYKSENGNGDINGYYVKPSKVTEKTAAVLVVHENRGLNPYIKDVARRVAKAGFIALAPDGLSSLGGYPGNDADGKTMQRKIDRTKLLNDFFNGFEFLYNHQDTTKKIGAVGFCYGGGVCNALAVAYPEMSASVPFYGSQAKADDVSRIKAPLLLHYAELDDRINKGWPEYEAALKANNKNYTAHIYKDCNHGFHNDSTPRYDEKNANLAWGKRTPAVRKDGQGYTKANKNVIVGNGTKNPEEIAKRLGLDSAADLNSFDSLLDAIKKNYGPKDVQQIVTGFIDNSVVKDIGVPSELQ